jgi:hypothetical protein
MYYYQEIIERVLINIHKTSNYLGVLGSTEVQYVHKNYTLLYSTVFRYYVGLIPKFYDYGTLFLSCGSPRK